MIIRSYDPKKRKEVIAGQFENNVFRKKVSPKHFMIKEKGYGISEDVIQQLIELDCKIVIIKSKTRTINKKFEDILNKPIKDYGHGKQRFVRVK
jgi:hypothetical protein